MQVKLLYQTNKVEFWAILFFAFLLRYFYGMPDRTIVADGIGYYDYLPASIHYQDINRHEQNYIPEHALYKRIDSVGKEIYVVNDVYLVNKYPIGTAICLAPFFTVTYLYFVLTHQQFTCYEYPFQLTVWIGALLFVFLALVYLRKLLLNYAISLTFIRWMQILLLLATPLTRYAHLEASMSHVYSLAIITATAYYARQFFQSANARSFVLTCMGFALVVLLRQVNGLVVLLLPFLAGNASHFSKGILWLIKHVKVLLLGLVLALLMLSVQCVFWWLQTGKFIIYSYTNERFYFNDPHFAEILFGFKKGLFIYTPILLLVFSGLYYFVKSKQWYSLFTWLIPFLMINYILSSWWSWFYGCSYGLRAYIDYFPFFFILIALALTHLTYKFWLVLFGLITIPVNLIQTYQYKNYILHWIDMDWSKYKRVFLHTEDQYGGLIWKPSFDYAEFDTLQEIRLGDVYVGEKQRQICTIPIDSMRLQETDMIQVKWQNKFNPENPADIELVCKDSSSDKLSFYANRRLVHFVEGELNTLQTGLYNFNYSQPEPTRGHFIILYERSNDDELLQDIRVLLLRKKK